MRTLTTLCVGALMLAGTAAYADCAEEIAALEGGISKDGTLAPLSGGAVTPRTPPAAEAAPDAGAGGGDGLAKDGTTEPLGADPEIATSGQDAQAQQQGGETAAEQAAGGGGGAAADPKAAALERAKAALAQGDEAACLSAVEAAKAGG